MSYCGSVGVGLFLFVIVDGMCLIECGLDEVLDSCDKFFLYCS